MAELKPIDHIDGMKWCLVIIERQREKYKKMGYADHDLPIEKVLIDIENEIGTCAFKDWNYRRTTND